MPTTRTFFAPFGAFAAEDTAPCAAAGKRPAWFLPGRTCVEHHDLGGCRFRFEMTVRHWLLGGLLRHDGVFRSVE